MQKNSTKTLIRAAGGCLYLLLANIVKQKTILFVIFEELVLSWYRAGFGVAVFPNTLKGLIVHPRLLREWAEGRPVVEVACFRSSPVWLAFARFFWP